MKDMPVMNCMMMGLSGDEKKTSMGSVYGSLTKAEKPAFTKMVTNCCMYGMKHAK